MDNERSSAINIGGKEYELILTTRATKAIAGRYGGLENLGEKLMKSENFEMALDEIVWLITLLANQSILIRNLKNKNAPEELLTEEEVELLTSPLDLAAYKNAITEAMFKGTKRDVESEEETPKNVEVGQRTQKSLPGFFTMEQFRWAWMQRNSGLCLSDCFLIYGPAINNGMELKSRRKPGLLTILSRRVFRRR